MFSNSSCFSYDSVHLSFSECQNEMFRTNRIVFSSTFFQEDIAIWHHNGISTTTRLIQVLGRWHVTVRIEPFRVIWSSLHLSDLGFSLDKRCQTASRNNRPATRPLLAGKGAFPRVEAVAGEISDLLTSNGRGDGTWSLQLHSGSTGRLILDSQTLIFCLLGVQPRHTVFVALTASRHVCLFHKVEVIGTENETISW